jgi:hypothetical protein
MRLNRHRLATAAAFVLVSLSAARANAQCCPGFTQQCAGTKSVWCVQNGAPAGTLPQAFCPYGDDVVNELETLFNIQAPSTFEFDVEWPANGGAHTGTDCSTFGDGVTGDAFATEGEGQINGFWGYLLALHEAINDWTGMSTPGWPTDYWADHISGFPNEMDWRIMGTLGAQLDDANLTASSTVQKARFWPGGDGPADSRVHMFDDVFVLPKMGNGYEGFSRIFGYIKGDGLSWDDVATNGANPDERRSEYVAAYLSLGAGQSVLPIMQTPAAGYAADASWAVCNGQWDGHTGDPNPSYTCSEANIDAIATAHCSIAANGMPAADLSSLRSGDFAMVPSGPCGVTCPSECACKMSTHECVAPWLGDPPPSDAGAMDGDSGAGVAPTDSGAGGVDASTGQSGSDGGGFDDTPTPSPASGCSCRAVGGESPPLPDLVAGAAFVALGLVRKRRAGR